MSRFDIDEELERRLRNIGADPQPPMPWTINRYLHQLPEGHPASASRFARLHRQAPATTGQSISIADRPRVRTSGPAGLRVLAGIAAVLVLVIAGGVMFSALRESGPVSNSPPAATPVPSRELWTGLEWHDITATSGGLFATDPWSSGITSSSLVAWPGGFAASAGSDIWSSADGRTWRRLAGPQYVKFVGSVGVRLIGITDPVASCEETAAGPCLTTGRIWSSANGVDWTSQLLPFSGSALSLTVSSKGAVIEALDGSDPTGPTLLYVSADGTSWRRASMPSDMSASLDMRVMPTAAGFVAQAILGGKYELWASVDGMTWSKISAVLPDTQAQITGVFQGLLGLSSPGLMGAEGLHSKDGSTWVGDQDQLVSALGGMVQVMADGTRVLVVGDWNSEFFVSLGDGHWRRLDQGGDIGSLLGGGQAWLLPNGVLYAGGGRLFFGQAIAGPPVQGTLRPAATITEPPTPTPPAGSHLPANSTSVVPAPTSQPTTAPAGP